MKLLNPLEKIKEIQQERAARPKQYNLSFGEQDPMDVISYAGLEEKMDHLIIDGQYRRTIFIATYPFVAEIGWLDSLTHVNHDIDISYHIENADSNEALKMLNKKITEFEAQRRSTILEGGIVGSEITDPLQSAEALRNAIRRGQQKLFHVSIYATIIANSLDELNERTNLIKSSLGALVFTIKTAYLRQIEGLQATLPRGENLLNVQRNMDSATAALTMPFVSSELVHPGGVLYGVNNSNNSLVIIDPFSLQNANSVLFATSGSGKSYAAKLEISRQLNIGTKVIVIDPEREYENLTKSVNGTYIKLSTNSKQKINPFDVATTSRDREQLADHIRDLTDVITVLVDGLTDIEKAAVDRAILRVYEKIQERQPILDDLYKELKGPKVADLRERLDKYISGSLAGVFNCPTNIVLDERLVVFDIKDMPKSIRKISMMVVANFVQNVVKQRPERRLLVIDEGWRLLEHEETGRFVEGLYREGRKNYLGVKLITQQVDDFLNNEHGRAIVAQSSMRQLMRQDSTTIDRVAEAFNLSEEEKAQLTRFGKGQMLIIADQQHVSVNIKASKEEDPLITTDPREVYGTV